jgi:hypothetical protein
VVLTAFCFLAGQPGKAVGEGIGNAKFHTLLQAMV